jgi:organic radical activating enzyme
MTDTIDEAMTDLNKSILLATGDGRGSFYSPEELMTLRINSWQGWRCAAGFENIHIGPIGQVTGAACSMPCYIGNIFDGPLNFPKDWLTCEVKWCMCGAAMRLRKAKTDDLRSELDREDLVKNVKAPLASAEDARLVTSPFLDGVRRFPKTVTWDISKRCNFNCSYCHPTVSNQTDPLRSREQVFGAVFKIIEGFGRGDRISWVFTGGEPTLHPFYDELCEVLFRKQHLIHTQTNGSRLPSYYAKLIHWSNIGISVHLEFSPPEKIIEVTRAVLAEKAADEQCAKHWFGLRIMTPPSWFQKSRDLMDQLQALPGFKEHGLVFMSATYDRENRDEMMAYPEDEYREILARS